jgi:hypothetical protein
LIIIKLLTSNYIFLFVATSTSNSTSGCIDKNTPSSACCSGNIEISTTITTLAVNAFYGCSSLTGDLYIPNNILTIGSQAFTACNGFNGLLHISENITSIPGYCFRDAKFTGSIYRGVTMPGVLYLHDKITSIGNFAFGYNTAFTTLNVPNTVVSLGRGSFYYMIGLTNLSYYSSTSTDIDVFKYCITPTILTDPFAPTPSPSPTEDILLTCTPYTVSNANFIPCTISNVCPGNTLTISSCETCSADQTMYLADINLNVLAFNDDGGGSCGFCSEIIYVTSLPCQDYVIAQACFQNTACGGTTIVRSTTNPTAQPTAYPTSPTSQPSGSPSSQPSGYPSAQPSGYPSSQPSGFPSSLPSGSPSNQPSGYPSSQPSKFPSSQPSSQPSGSPSNQPSDSPSSRPSSQPSSQPSGSPSSQPSGYPSSQPSGSPSNQPSSSPSNQPSSSPSNQPTGSPSSHDLY